jgi:hypothetical protein
MAWKICASTIFDPAIKPICGPGRVVCRERYHFYLSRLPAHAFSASGSFLRPTLTSQGNCGWHIRRRGLGQI